MLFSAHPPIPQEKKKPKHWSGALIGECRRYPGPQNTGKAHFSNCNVVTEISTTDKVSLKKI